jgi:hydroxypyruvate isomerase
MSPRFSAHLDTLYTELVPADRYEAAARDGFRCVELWSPPSQDVPRVIDSLTRYGLRLASVNTHQGPHAEDFGQLGNPDAVGWWRADFLHTLDFARTTGAHAINVLAGGRLGNAPRSGQLRTAADNLDWALGHLADDDPVLLLEPLNSADRRSPLLRNVADALSIIEVLGTPGRLRVLFDAYHLFQEEDDLMNALREAAGLIGHIQIADYPGRNEPGSGEIPFEDLLVEIDRTGYTGWIGLEYFPSGFDASIGWLDAYVPRDGAA